MKRAISMLLAIALACSFVFAGSAAALDINEADQDLDQDADLDQYADADVDQTQAVSQDNVALQGGNVAYGSSATAVNVADQTNNNAQIGVAEAENEGYIDQDADQEAENEIEFDW